jgi:acetoin utilization protein AcuC
LSQIPIFYSDELGQFDFGAGHPLTGSRFRGFMGLLDKAGILPRCRIIPPVPASESDLLLAHTPDYLAMVEKLKESGGWLSIDTPVTRGATEAQRLIAGSALQAVELLLKGDDRIAHTFGGFHHAGKDFGEGFCIYNDVAIAAKALVERHGIERILILDSDAHQGNGTMDIFHDDPRVLFVSIHQDPLTIYPGKGFVWETGAGAGDGFTVNIPMPPLSGSAQYIQAFESIIEPIARAFKPQFFIRNGGSDPFFGDDLTMLGLDLDGLSMVSRRTRDIALETAGNLLDMTVSGYGDWVTYGWLAQFCGTEALDTDYKLFSPKQPRRNPASSDESLTRATASMLDSLKRELGKKWDIF